MAQRSGTLRRMMLAVGGGLLATASMGSAATPSAGLTVVELFQSQGCSSCPPAIANVNALADRPDVLALDFAVTYWDQLGWKDTFAAPVFTQRQWAYAHGMRRANVATPQVVLNGHSDLVGADREQLSRAVASAGRLDPGLVRIAPGHVLLGAGRPSAKPADVWLLRYDPRSLQVNIGAGENSGVTLAHRNIVRSMVRLGGWTGQGQTLPLAPPAPGLRTAVLLQAPDGGPILGAAKG